MKIFIKKWWFGHIITLDVEPSNTIQTVYEKIQEQDGIPADQQWLIFGGQHLEDSKTLADYEVQNESTLLLMIWVRDAE